jgi:hypothetical protein
MARSRAALAAARLEERFDAAVFERMKRHDGQAAAGGEQPLRCREAAIEFAKLVVDPDAQRLERARRRIDGLRRGVHDPPHDGGQFQRARNRALGAVRDNGARNAARLPLFAVAEQDIGEFGFAQLVDGVGGCRAVAAHAHVERAVEAEREATPGVIDLRRRDAKVERHAVDRGDTARVE